MMYKNIQPFSISNQTHKHTHTTTYAQKVKWKPQSGVIITMLGPKNHLTGVIMRVFEQGTGQNEEKNISVWVKTAN